MDSELDLVGGWINAVVVSGCSISALPGEVAAVSQLYEDWDWCCSRTPVIWAVSAKSATSATIPV
jgi:hypothetical protein